jgi:crotonobetainyl-CoA:carnitine CoA-transferase CaiB-like acyl-CoA transferase
MIGIQNEREWRRFCEDVLQIPGVATREIFTSNSLRVENRDQLDATIDSVFSQLPLEEVVERLRAASVAYARMNSVEELANHPQLRLITIDIPAGSVTLPASPVPYRDAAETPRPSVPALGEHTEAIRNEFGG